MTLLARGERLEVDVERVGHGGICVGHVPDGRVVFIRHAIPGERVIPESSGFEETVSTILHTSGLADAAATTPCPAHCSHC